MALERTWIARSLAFLARYLAESCLDLAIPRRVLRLVSEALFFSISYSFTELNTDAALDRYYEEQQSPLTSFELFDMNISESFEFETIAFENMKAETIFELQQAYDPNFYLKYEDYED